MCYIIWLISFTGVRVLWHFRTVCYCMPNPLAALSKARVCGRPLVGIMGSSSAVGIDVCLLWVWCVVTRRSLASGRSIVQRSLTECRVSEGDIEASTVRRSCPLGAVAPWGGGEMLFHKSPSWNRVCKKRGKYLPFWFCLHRCWPCLVS